jgi:ABC-2 type transport system permease protein
MSGRHAIMLVARREIRERLRSRAFLVATVILLVAVGASTAFTKAYSSEKTYRVAVIAPAPRGLDAALLRAAKPFDTKVRLHVLASAAAGRDELTGKKVDALLLLERNRLLFRTNVDTKLAAMTDTAVRALRHHLPPTPELTAATVEPAASAETTDAEVAVALFSSGLMLFSIWVYGEWVLVGVVEEKSNRVVELILSAVRPRHLLAGKVIGLGLLGLAQLVLVAGLAAALLVGGVFDAPRSLSGSLALVVPWFVFGFALYAVVFAAAGALASRQQDASTAGQPVAITLMVMYFVGYIALAEAPDGTLANVLSVFPLSAPFVLPARSALVGVPLWEHALALVLVLSSIYGIVRLAGRVYAHGLLHTGSRLDPRTAWRLSHHH